MNQVKFHSTPALCMKNTRWFLIQCLKNHLMSIHFVIFNFGISSEGTEWEICSYWTRISTLILPEAHLRPVIGRHRWRDEAEHFSSSNGFKSLFPRCKRGNVLLFKGPLCAGRPVLEEASLFLRHWVLTHTAAVVSHQAHVHREVIFSSSEMLWITGHPLITQDGCQCAAFCFFSVVFCVASADTLSQNIKSCDTKSPTWSAALIAIKSDSWQHL